eukprot:10968361-Lingulodinium_polyedra.AAC.1
MKSSSIHVCDVPLRVSEIPPHLVTEALSEQIDADGEKGEAITPEKLMTAAATTAAKVATERRAF